MKPQYDDTAIPGKDDHKKIVDKLFKKNLTALKPYLAKSYYNLLTNIHLKSYITGSLTTKDLNVVTDGINLYQPDAQTCSESAIEQYIENPERILLRFTLLDQNQDWIGGSVTTSLYKKLSTMLPLVKDNDRVFNCKTSMMLVFGVGLGLHLEKLIDARLDFQSMVLYEPNIELFVLSMHVIDYQHLIRKLKKRGGNLHIILHSNTQLAASMIVACMNLDDYGLVNGTYYHIHYRFSGLDDCLLKLRELSLIAYDGWLEDETINAFNTIRNTRMFDGRAIDNKCKLAHDLPAFVIGNGPSLTKDLDHIYAMQNNAIIISAGTALKSLLDAGIKPDFHTELENTEATGLILRRVSLDYDLSDIIVFLSTCCSPYVAGCFQKLLFYKRGTNNIILNGMDMAIESIYGVSPSCTNAAMILATKLKCKEIYLFGVDLGSQTLTQTHAKNSVYDNNYVTIKASNPYDSSNVVSLKHQLEGNFGGHVYSSPIYIKFRESYEQALARFDIHNCYNCSDGAKIFGAIPLYASDIKLKKHHVVKTQIVDKLFCSFKYYERNTILPPKVVDKFVQDEEVLITRLRDSLHVQDNNLLQLYNNLISHVSALRSSNQQARSRDTKINSKLYLRATHYTTFIYLFHVAFEYWAYANEDERKVVFEHTKYACEKIIERIPLTFIAFGYEAREKDNALFYRLLGDGNICKAIYQYGLTLTEQATLAIYEQLITSDTPIANSNAVDAKDQVTAYDIVEHGLDLNNIEFIWKQLSDRLFEIAPNESSNLYCYMNYAVSWGHLEEAFIKLHKILISQFKDMPEYIDSNVILKYAGCALLFGKHYYQAIQWLNAAILTSDISFHDKALCDQLYALKLFIEYKIGDHNAAKKTASLLSEYLQIKDEAAPVKHWYGILALSAWARINDDIKEAKKLLQKSQSVLGKVQDLDALRMMQALIRIKREQILLDGNKARHQLYWDITLPIEWLLDDVQMIGPKSSFHINQKAL